MCLGGSDPPPPQPVPTPAPPPAKKPKEAKNPSLVKRKQTRRRGGMKSYTINRTTPNIGAQGEGARAV